MVIRRLLTQPIEAMAFDDFGYGWIGSAKRLAQDSERMGCADDEILISHARRLRACPPFRAYIEQRAKPARASVLNGRTAYRRFADDQRFVTTFSGKPAGSLPFVRCEVHDGHEYVEGMPSQHDDPEVMF